MTTMLNRFQSGNVQLLRAESSATPAKLREELPSIDNYRNPGPETTRERIKLRLLHGTAQLGGGLRRLFGRLSKSSVGVLTYHRITPQYDRVPFPTINVTPETFRRQLTGLQQQGFHFRSLNSILNAISQHPTSDCDLKERTVVVTFDDIYDNVFQHAFPVLQDLQIPATVFISTAFVDSPDPFLFDPWAIRHRAIVPTVAWRPVSDLHLRQMLASDLIDIGAHTHTHQDFRQRPQEFVADVERSIELLSDRYGVENLPFAFPYGSPRSGFCNSAMMDSVHRLGLTCGLTTGPQTNQLNSSPFGWGRFHVFEHDTVASLAAKLDGWNEWLPKLKTNLTRHSDN